MRIRLVLSTALAAGLLASSTGTGQMATPYGGPSMYPNPSAPYAAGGYPAPSPQRTSMTTPAWNPPRMASAQDGVIEHLPATQSGGDNATMGPPQVPPQQAVVGNGSNISNGYMNAMSAPWDAACGPDCGPVLPPVQPCCPKWFGGVYAIFLDMADEDPVYFGFAPTDPSSLYLSNREADMNTAAGVEVRVGKTFCNCRLGLEFVYWEVFPEDQCTRAYADDEGRAGFHTTMDYQDVWLDFTDGAPPDSHYRDTIHNAYNVNYPIQAMELHRSWNIRNFELNLLSGPLVSANAGCGGGACGACDGGAVAVGAPYCGGTGCGYQPRLSAGWVFGFRYFQFDEYMGFIAENDDGYIDYDSPNYEFKHEVDVKNYLAGFQFGLNTNYCLTQCLHLQAGSAFGLFNNRADVYQGIFNGNGDAYTNPSNPDWWVNRNAANDVAFLGELRAGVGYKLGCHWRVTGGYRAVAACGIARALDQLPQGRMYSAQNRVAVVDRDSCLVLHGAYAGAEFAW